MNLTDGRTQTTPSNTFTVIKHVDAKRVYERLRKRSYRQIEHETHSHPWYMHQAYVQGVKDALNDVIDV